MLKRWLSSSVSTSSHSAWLSACIGALRGFIEYVKSHDGVWFASREAIACWYLENHESHIPAKV